MASVVFTTFVVGNYTTAWAYSFWALSQMMQNSSQFYGQAAMVTLQARNSCRIYERHYDECQTNTDACFGLSAARKRCNDLWNDDIVLRVLCVIVMWLEIFAMTVVWILTLLRMLLTMLYIIAFGVA